MNTPLPSAQARAIPLVIQQGKNRYHFSIHNGTLADIDVLRFSGHSALSEGYQVDIEFTSSDPDILPEQVIHKEGELAIWHLGKTAPFPTLPTLAQQICGVITQFERLHSSVDETRYRVRLEDHLALLDYGQNTMVFQHRSVSEIVEAVLRQHTDYAYQGWMFEFRLRDTYPKYPFTLQFAESDRQFIRRLLAAEGIYTFFRLHPDVPHEVVIFADHQRFYDYEHRALPLRPPAGMAHEETGVWALSYQQQIVPKTVSLKAYHRGEAWNPLYVEGQDNTKGDDPTTHGEVYRHLAPYTDAGPAFYPRENGEIGTGRQMAHLTHQRHLAHQQRLRGQSDCVTLQPNVVLNITGEGIPTPFKEGVLIVNTQFAAARDSAFELTFEGIPFSEFVCYRPAEIPKPVMSGTLPAIIESREAGDTYAYLTDTGLYPVRFKFDRSDNPRSRATIPLQLARPYGGQVYGFHMPLLDGTEVLVAFQESDPDKPYIASVMHNSTHPDLVTKANHKRNVIRTPANNKLRLDDTRGQESIKVSTEYGGKSQVNLGYLVDAERQLRGEGFELRTDDWGAIRAGKGLFISTDKRASASSNQRDMAEALSQLQMALQQAESLKSAAETAQAELADVKRQKDLLEKEIAQTLEKAAMVLSAPAGIAQTTPKNLQLAAGENLVVNTGHSADFSLIKKLTVAAGERIGLFAHKLGMRLIANQGKIQVQAQNDAMELTAAKALTITSTQDEIIISARKKITLIAGGSYIHIDPYKIEHGTAGDFNVKSAAFAKTGPAQMNVNHPEYPKATIKQVMNLNLNQLPGNTSDPYAILSDEPYKLYADGKLIHEGLSDAQGNILIQHELPVQEYTVELVNGHQFTIPVKTKWATAAEQLAGQGFRAYSIHNEQPWRYWQHPVDTDNPDQKD